MTTWMKIGLAVGGAALAYTLFKDNLAVGDQVLVPLASLPTGTASPEFAALAPGARVVIKISALTGQTFSGAIQGFTVPNVGGGPDNFTSLPGPNVGPLNRNLIVGVRK